MATTDALREQRDLADLRADIEPTVTAHLPADVLRLVWQALQVDKLSPEQEEAVSALTTLHFSTQNMVEHQVLEQMRGAS